MSMHASQISRAETIDRLTEPNLDLLVIGGGITGARVAFEGARLGLRVALVEAGDFGGGTSSASSKLVHGGFRYLPMGDIALVRESQRERAVLMDRVAPNLVRPLPFLLPVYAGARRGPATVATGLLLYRLLGGRGGRVSILRRRDVQDAAPGMRLDGLRMCGVFDEAETIDARLVLATVKAAARAGALVLNHARVVGLELRHNRGGAVAIDAGRDGVFELRVRDVVNAAGPWVDRVRALDDPRSRPLVRLSKGVHLLLAQEQGWSVGVAKPLGGGRVALAIPWQGMLMLGTTDTPYDGDPAAVCVTEADVSCILDEASGFVESALLARDRVRFETAGLRALPMADCETAAARREHVIEMSRNGMISVAGGKLTTHRLIACDALRRLPRWTGARIAPDDRRLPGTGWSLDLEDRPDVAPDVADHLERMYGDEAGRVVALAASTPGGLERIHHSGPDVWAQVAYAFQREWAQTVDDVARRRTTLAMRGLLTEEIATRMAAMATSLGELRLPPAAASSDTLPNAVRLRV